jgi:hypothetical protein
MFNCKSRRIRWAGHVERMDENTNVYRVLIGNLNARDHFETCAKIGVSN